MLSICCTMDLVTAIIATFDSGPLRLYMDKKCTNVLNIQSDKKSFQLSLQVSGSALAIKPHDEKVENVHLACIIVAKKFNDVNHIFELLEFLTKEVPNITNYCTCCYKKMDFQSDKYITCGGNDCNYKYEELIIGNIVLDKLKDDPNIVHFLIQSANDAVVNRPDIFEPFPTQFLVADVKLERGNISKLKGVSYDKYKDFTKLKKCLSDFNFEKLLKIAELTNSDYELAKVLGEDLYKLIRFIIMSCKVDIVKDDTVINKKTNSLSIYKILHPADIEGNFAKTTKASSDKDKTCYLFHGSGWHNWYSILRNGLKNCSQTTLMTTGAVYGNGVYLSDNLDVSIQYGYSSATHNQKSVVGVFEVVGQKSDYLKTAGIYVVADEKLLIQRYLIILGSGSASKFSAELNAMFNSKIYEDKVKTATVVFGKGIKKIVKEYKNILTQKPESVGFRIDVNPNNLYLWKVFLFGYNKDDAIGKDMIKYNVKEIEMEVLFPPTYPMAPPFVRVIKPRFQHLTGHITTGGSICTQILTEKYWSPACSMEALIMTIKSEILEGDGRLDPKMYNIEYSEKEARDSFVRVAKGHGWM